MAAVVAGGCANEEANAKNGLAGDEENTATAWASGSDAGFIVLGSRENASSQSASAGTSGVDTGSLEKHLHSIFFVKRVEEKE